MGTDNSQPRWFLVVRGDQHELLDILKGRLEGSDIEVVPDRRSRERRRGSFGPAMDRRVNDRRRPRPIAQLSVVAPAKEATTEPAATRRRLEGARNGSITHPCPTCAEPVELELPRFPQPPARVEMEVGHSTGNGNGRGAHYVEIAAFTVSGRLILSQRVPGRRPA
jgi:hypothetical protein